MIRLTRPWFDDAEHAGVDAVLRSGMLVQGAQVAAFEASLQRALTARGAAGGFDVAAVATGTVALELALASSPTPAGVGDEVIVPAVTWPSPGHAVILRGATPVVVDVDPLTWNLSPATVAPALTDRTRALIAVDQFGVPADVPALRAVAPSIDLIEDAACALGSSLHGALCGLLGDVGTYSFHPRKVITTAEGGAVLTRDPSRAARVRALRNHGQATPGVFVDAGPNARMSELHAALGVAQMEKLDAILARRVERAERIRGAVKLRWQGAPEGATVNHQTLGFVLPPREGMSRAEARDAVIAALHARDVQAGVLSYALHRLPQFARFAVNAGRALPVAEAVVDGGVAVPLHPLMSDGDVDVVITALRELCGWAEGINPFEGVA
ncbi:MAG: DegT/DnrJ/EryC1/StrS family aminotransferase [Polyangiales bacterium]